MINTTDCNAKKTTGLGDLFKDYAPQQLEEEKQFSKRESVPLDRLLKKYEELHDSKYHLLSDILPPFAINDLLQMIAIHDPSSPGNIALFINKMISNSYEAGYNHFDLIIPQHCPPIPSLASDTTRVPLMGKKKNLLRLIATGDVGPSFAAHMHHACYRIAGSVDVDFALAARDSYFTIDKNCLQLPGNGAQRCTFILYGEVIGISPFKVLPHQCTYKTSNSRTLQALIDSGIKKSGNRLYFLDKGGRKVLQ